MSKAYTENNTIQQDNDAQENTARWLPQLVRLQFSEYLPTAIHDGVCFLFLSSQLQ